MVQKNYCIELPTMCKYKKIWTILVIACRVEVSPPHVWPTNTWGCEGMRWDVHKCMHEGVKAQGHETVPKTIYNLSPPCPSAKSLNNFDYSMCGKDVATTHKMTNKGVRWTQECKGTKWCKNYVFCLHHVKVHCPTTSKCKKCKQLWLQQVKWRWPHHLPKILSQKDKTTN